jgi:hypothetical protein
VAIAASVILEVAVYQNDIHLTDRIPDPFYMASVVVFFIPGAPSGYSHCHFLPFKSFVKNAGFE